MGVYPDLHFSFIVIPFFNFFFPRVIVMINWTFWLIFLLNAALFRSQMSVGNLQNDYSQLLSKIFLGL